MFKKLRFWNKKRKNENGEKKNMMSEKFKTSQDTLLEQIAEDVKNTKSKVDLMYELMFAQKKQDSLVTLEKNKEVVVEDSTVVDDVDEEVSERKTRSDTLENDLDDIGLYKMQDACIRELNTMIVKVGETMKTEVSLDEVKKLYAEFTVVRSMLDNVKMSMLVAGIERNYKSLSMLKKVHLEDEENSSVIETVKKDTQRSYKYTIKYLKTIGFEIIEPQEGDSYDGNTMEMANAIDFTEKEKTLIVESVLKLGYQHMINKNDMVRSLVIVREEEKNNEERRSGDSKSRIVE